MGKTSDLDSDTGNASDLNSDSGEFKLRRRWHDGKAMLGDSRLESRCAYNGGANQSPKNIRMMNLGLISARNRRHKSSRCKKMDMGFIGSFTLILGLPELWFIYLERRNRVVGTKLSLRGIELGILGSHCEYEPTRLDLKGEFLKIYIIDENERAGWTDLSPDAKASILSPYKIYSMHLVGRGSCCSRSWKHVEKSTLGLMANTWKNMGFSCPKRWMFMVIITIT